MAQSILSNAFAQVQWKQPPPRQSIRLADVAPKEPITPAMPATQAPYDTETGNGDPYSTIQAYEASKER
jgi:hypothetical protein